MSQVKTSLKCLTYYPSPQGEEEESDSESPNDGEDEEDTDTEKDNPEKNNNQGDIVKKKFTEAFDEDNTSDEEVFEQECPPPVDIFPVHLPNYKSWFDLK